MVTKIGPTGQRFDLIAPTSRDHDPIAREALRRAGLSMEAELDADQARILRGFCDEFGEDVPGHRLRIALLPSLRGVDGLNPADTASITTNESLNKGESIMAKTKAGRPSKSAPTKAQIAKVAQMRRAGATWDEVISETGIRTNSTGFRELLESANFDKYGRKGGRGESKAKGWGSADMKGNGSKPSKAAPKKKARKVKRTKATAKK